jgi:hypothetical protein
MPMANVTKEGKPTAWATVQVVENENGNIIMYLSRSGPDHENADAKRNKEAVHIRFSKRTGQSGNQAHRKLKRLIDQEQ